MQYRFDVTTLTRALPIMLAIGGFGSGAYADDEYGTGHASLVQQSAASSSGAPLTVAQAKSAAQQFSYRDIYDIPPTPSWASSPGRPQYATSAGMPPARDLVGDGGDQDNIARAIHHPGSGTDW